MYRKESQEGREPRFVCPVSERPHWDFNGRWETLVNYMGGLTGIRDLIFIREYPSRSERRVRWHRAKGRFLKPSHPDPDTTRVDFTATAGRIYNLQLKHISARRRVASIDLPNEIASICGPFLKQSADGIDGRYLIALKPSFRTQVSAFIIRVDPPSKDNNESEEMKFCSSEISGVLTVKPPKGWLVLSIVLVIIGVVSFAIPEDLGTLVEYLSGKPYKNISTIFFKVIGIILPILGGFIGLGKCALQIK